MTFSNAWKLQRWRSLYRRGVKVSAPRAKARRSAAVAKSVGKRGWRQGHQGQEDRQEAKAAKRPVAKVKRKVVAKRAKRVYEGRRSQESDRTPEEVSAAHRVRTQQRWAAPSSVAACQPVTDYRLPPSVQQMIGAPREHQLSTSRRVASNSGAMFISPPCRAPVPCNFVTRPTSSGSGPARK